MKTSLSFLLVTIAYCIFAQSTTIVISEVYGGGGATSGTVPFKNDYVELYNMTDKDIEMKDWSIQYNSAAGTNAYQSNTFSGIIKAKSFFLIQLGGGTIGGDLSNPDFIGNLNLSASNGKIALRNNSTALAANSPAVGDGIVDFVGYGSANTFEGTTAALALTNTSSLERKANALSTEETMSSNGIDAQKGNGFDTNNNGTDFIRISKPDPQNSKSPQEGLNSLVPSIVLSSSSINFGSVPSGQISSPIVIRLITANLTKNVSIRVSDNFLVSKSSGGPFGDSISFVASDLNNTKDIFLIFTPVEKGPTKGKMTVTSSDLVNIVEANLSGIGLERGEYFFDFQNCTTALSDGFTQFSSKGDQVWSCTTFGRDAADPNGKANKPGAIQISGFQTVANENEDWLLSPEIHISSNPLTFPTLSFYSRTRFSGKPLELRISENFIVGQNPTSPVVKWESIDVKLPATDSDTWTLTSAIDLSKYRGKKITLAWVYQSTTSEAARWTLDDIKIDNALNPVPGLLSMSSKSIYFGYLPINSTALDSFKLEANPFENEVKLSINSPYLLSINNATFSENLTVKPNQKKINNTIFVKANPKAPDLSYIDTINISVDQKIVSKIIVNCNTINPEKTLDILAYNIEWFGGMNGPVNDSLQVANATLFLKNINADILGLSEIVDTLALKRMTENIGVNKDEYGYYVSKYASNASSPASANYSSGQKLAFVYRTKNIKPISIEPLFYTPDANSLDYSNWTSGRFPLMMTAEVALSGQKKEMAFILIHGKAQNSADAYMKRKNAALSLHDYIQKNLKDKSVVILGDFNDDLDETLGSPTQVGADWPKSSYDIFTKDTAKYLPVTLPLSLNKETSTVRFSEVIDHIILTSNLKQNYIKNSAQILDEISKMIQNYSTTTSDHYPVLTRLSFDLISSIDRDDELETSFKIYPNPSTDFYTVEGLDGPIQIKVFNLAGRFQYSINLEPGNSTFSLENLKPGTYVGVLENKSKFRVIKLVKM